MKTKSHFYRSSTFFSLLFLAATTILHGQFDILLEDNGFVKYTIDEDYESAHIFTLYGDGTFGNLSAPEHQFSHAGDYTSTAYIVEPYETIVPESIVVIPIEEFEEDYTPIENPEVAMDGEVDIMTSWATASDQENFFIVAFKNESSDVAVGGHVVLHYLSTDLMISGDILEYEGWVSPWEPGDSELVAYDKKLTWEFADLAPDETRYIYVPAIVKLPVGESLGLKAEYYTGRGKKQEQKDIENSTFPVRKYPHDPNFKTVNKTCIHPDDPSQTLEYTIGFFNDGEAFANDIWLVDELSSLLDPGTVMSLDAEYGHTMSVTGSELEIEFLDIDLPGTNQVSPNAYSYDEAFTYVTFSVCTRGAILYGTCIDNMADIIFDTQAPIATTTATVCSGQPCYEFQACSSSPPDFKQAPTSMVFLASPNPMSDELNIHIANEVAIQGLVDLEILDYTGKRVKQLWHTKEGLTTFQQQFEIGNLPPGLYLLTLKMEDKVYTQKLIKK